MGVTRRDFIKVGASAVGAATLPPWLVARPRALGRPLDAPLAGDPGVKALALRAIDAARAAGAAYADVRLTRDQGRSFINGAVGNAELLAVGVRALVDGYWGFAASALWTPDEMARLGAEAVSQARTNALGKTRVVELAAIPVVPDGHWTTPIAIDPFDVPIGEVLDYLGGLVVYTGRTFASHGTVRLFTSCQFYRQEKAFASTDGSYLTQRLYRTGGGLTVSLEKGIRGPQGAASSYVLEAAGRGWEYIREAPAREEIARLVDEIEEDLRLPVKPVEIGRFDVAFDARSVGALLDDTLGYATELDRALGYEANAGGTSYLGDPLGMLGSQQVGAEGLTVTGNRSAPGGLATAKWDDEGVEPDAFTLVRDGVLTDFMTTRESAGWLEDYYTKQGRPVRSHGCANATGALNAPMLHPPNLAIAPGREAIGFDDLVKGIKRGLLMKEVRLDMDFQHLNGLATGNVYEIRDGRRVARMGGAGILFRAPELWKGLQALGGAESARPLAAVRVKGEPAQSTMHTVMAVPATFKELSVIEPGRRA